MEKEYVITPSGNFIETDYLQHWGIKGMKWGVRRYQNPDGSLTPAGERRRARLEGQLDKLGGPKKKSSGDSDKRDDTSAEAPKKKGTSDMSDKELQDKVNRLRNEDAFRDLNKKLGYDEPKTELDSQIADLKRQKEYMELQRDIKKLNRELNPAKKSKLKEIMGTVLDDVLIPSATKAGKEFLTSYLTAAGADVLAKTAKKEGSKIKNAVDKSAENAKAEKKIKEESQRRSMEEYEKEINRTNVQGEHSQKGGTRETINPNKSTGLAVYTPKEQGADYRTHEGTVEGTGTSKRNKYADASWTKTGNVVDAESWSSANDDSPVTSMTTKNASSGRSYVSGYLNAPIAGLLPPPKDDD